MDYWEGQNHCFRPRHKGEQESDNALSYDEFDADEGIWQ